MENRSAKKLWSLGKRHASPAATAGFLLLALLLLAGCILLVARMLKHEFPKGRGKDAEAVATAAPETTGRLVTPAPDDAWIAAAIRTPLPTAFETPTPTPTPTPALTPSPAPTLRPIADAPAFTNERMDFYLLGFDESGHADWIALVALTENDCRILSIPRNTLTTVGATLSSATSATRLLQMAAGAFPVRCRYYVSMKTASIPQCVDAFDGLSLGGAVLTGKEVATFLETGGGDELLRIGRQQEVLRACIGKAKSTGLVQVWKSRNLLSDTVQSNIERGQLLPLFMLLRGLSDGDLSCSLLPVDSLSLGGERRYRVDAERTNLLAIEWVSGA